MFITWIARLIAGLNANQRPGEIAAAVAMGALLALLPGGNLLWPLILILTALTKINLAMELVVIAVFRPLAPSLDPLLHRIGEALLTNPGVYGVVSALYDLPLVSLTRINNTVVAGSLVAGIVLWVPLFFLARVLVRVYRSRIHPRLAESKVVKAFTRIPIVSRIIGLVRKFQRIYGIVA